MLSSRDVVPVPVFGGTITRGLVCILVNPQDTPMFSDINGKLSLRPFRDDMAKCTYILKNT